MIPQTLQNNSCYNSYIQQMTTYHWAVHTHNNWDPGSQGKFCDFPDNYKKWNLISFVTLPRKSVED